MIGELIDNEYRVEERIGKGSFGVVYRCTEVSLGRTVAIKMLNVEAVQEKNLRRFINEGRNLASLNHPNVIQIHRLGDRDEQPYIVMEFVEGKTVRNLVRHRQLSLGWALDIMSQVAGGLSAIHRAGIVHRDLSTNNIMVRDDGIAKILDLGLSSVVNDIATMSQQAYLAGTILYIAPEIIEGEGATFASDVFSFGVILYEVLTGTNPFVAEHPTSILYNIYNIANRPPVRPSVRVPGLPDGLSDVVLGCLEPRPEDRTASLQDIARRLREFAGLASSEQSLPPPPTTLMARPSEAKRNPYLNRVMIKRHRDFIGRSREVKRIFARLNATPPGSISIVGDRRIGKSSLLNYIYMKQNRATHLENPDRTIMVFMDLQEETEMTLEKFAQRLITLARYESQNRVSLPEISANLDGIKALLQHFDRGGFRLAILFDEFEIITTNENFTLEFFSFLRFLANHHDMAYITSSAKDLQVLCHTKEISDSPFFNIFSTMRISAFQEEEALRLITEPSSGIGLDLAPHAEHILHELSGLFPIFIQIACSHFIEYLQDSDHDGRLDLEAIKDRYLEEAKPHYQYIWTNFGEHEQEVISQVVQGKNVPDSLQHVLLELETKKYVLAEGSQVRVFSTTFRDFIRTKIGRTTKGSFWTRLFGGAR